MTGYKEVRIGAWSALAKIFRSDLDNGEEIVYRGQSDANWSLSASFDRKLQGNVVERQSKFEAFLRLFRRRFAMRSATDLTDDQLCSLAQHYGLHTRFLDWTTKPYIALFFACVPGLVETPCAVYSLNKTRMAKYVPEAEFSFIFAESKENARLEKQHGCLLKNGSHYSCLEEYYNSRDDIEDQVMVKYIISKSTRKKIFSDLQLMGIGYSSLFDGVEYIAKELNMSITSG